ncbi:MAG TPA: hypothetical protein VFY19_03435, partial [Geminicoccaceae bacterium]|nr:hypothetical protein [Geminicoccaceae bacterium]
MAALTIRWTKQAIADNGNVYDFVSASNPRAAKATIGTSIKPSPAWPCIPEWDERVASAERPRGPARPRQRA